MIYKPGCPFPGVGWVCQPPYFALSRSLSLSFQPGRGSVGEQHPIFFGGGREDDGEGRRDGRKVAIMAVIVVFLNLWFFVNGLKPAKNEKRWKEQCGEKGIRSGGNGGYLCGWLVVKQKGGGEILDDAAIRLRGEVIGFWERGEWLLREISSDGDWMFTKKCLEFVEEIH